MSPGAFWLHYLYHFIVFIGIPEGQGRRKATPEDPWQPLVNAYFLGWRENHLSWHCCGRQLAQSLQICNGPWIQKAICQRKPLVLNPCQPTRIQSCPWWCNFVLQTCWSINRWSRRLVLIIMFNIPC